MWKNLLLTIGSLITVIGLCILIRNIGYKYKSPTGKKGSIVSFHAAIATAIVVLTVYITMTLEGIEKYLLIIFSIVLAYLVIKNKYDSKEHYLYQLIFGIIIGGTIPFGLNYASTALFSSSQNELPEREYAPEGIVDDRKEADSAPELKLEEIDEN